LAAQGITAGKLPVVAVSVAENELRWLDPATVKGHLAARNAGCSSSARRLAATSFKLLGCLRGQADGVLAPGSHVQAMTGLGDGMAHMGQEIAVHDDALGGKL
jgi:hypothetical protein